MDPVEEVGLTFFDGQDSFFLLWLFFLLTIVQLGSGALLCVLLGCIYHID